MTVKLIILDYEAGKIHVYNVKPETDIDEQFIEKLGFHLSSCEWMFGKNIGLEIHGGIMQ